MDARVCTPSVALSRSNPCVKGSIHLLTESQESCETGNNHFWRDSRDSGGDKKKKKKKKEKVRKFQPPWRVTIRPELSSRASFPNKIRVSRIPDEFPDAIP